LFPFLGYLHICIGTTFLAWFSLSFTPLYVRKKWFKWVTYFAIFTTFCMLLHLVKDPVLPGCFSKSCTKNITGTLSCSFDSFRSYMGNWHIAWLWPLNGCNFQYIYLVNFYFIPLLYAGYRIVLYGFILGLLPPLLFVNTAGLCLSDEISTIWCLLSIAYMVSVNIPCIERFLTVKPKA
jgi:hypothetical protein